MGIKKTGPSYSVSTRSPTNSKSLSGSLVDFIGEFYKGITIARPVVVTKYIRKHHRVRVRPIVRYGYLDENFKRNFVERSEFEVPCQVFSHGGYTLEWPYFAGDTGWVISSDFDYQPPKADRFSLLKELTKVEDRITKPGSFAIHELGNGVFIPDSWARACEFKSESDSDESIESDEYEELDYETRQPEYEKDGDYKKKASKFSVFKKLSNTTLGLSLSSTIGDDDRFDQFYQKYFHSNTCAISLRSGEIIVTCEGGCRYRDEGDDSLYSGTSLHLLSGLIEMRHEMTEVSSGIEKNKSSMCRISPTNCFFRMTTSKYKVKPIESDIVVQGNTETKSKKIIRVGYEKELVEEEKSEFTTAKRDSHTPCYTHSRRTIERKNDLTKTQECILQLPIGGVKSTFTEDEKPTEYDSDGTRRRKEKYSCMDADYSSLSISKRGKEYTEFEEEESDSDNGIETNALGDDGESKFSKKKPTKGYSSSIEYSNGVLTETTEKQSGTMIHVRRNPYDEEDNSMIWMEDPIVKSTMTFDARPESMFRIEMNPSRYSSESTANVSVNSINVEGMTDINGSENMNVKSEVSFNSETVTCPGQCHLTF